MLSACSSVEPISAPAAAKIEQPRIPPELLQDCAKWVYAPDYGLTVQSSLEDVQRAFDHAATVHAENKAAAEECAADKASLNRAVLRRQ